LGAGVIFALSLIFSNAGERPNLKTAGIFIFITNLVLGFAFIWSLSSRDIQTYNTFEKFNQWGSLVSSLIPILFIRNFRSEIKTLKTKNATTALSKTLENVLDFVAVISLIFTLVFGIWMALESYWKLDWINRGPEKVQQIAKAFETRIFVNSQGDTMHYLLMKPLDYDPQMKYPLVVCLHGGPGPVKKNQIRKVEVPQPAPLLSNRINREKYPAYIFVPQAPPGHSWGGIPYVPDVDTLVFETIHALEEEFDIDEKRRYVAGGSGGGYGSWHFIGVRPEMFAAAIPVCGAGNPELAQNMVDTPVWAFHGSNDRNVPVNASREMIEAIKNAGGNPLYTEFPGVGHNTWPHVIKTPGLLDWLFAQKRD